MSEVINWYKVGQENRDSTPPIAHGDPSKIPDWQAAIIMCGILGLSTFIMVKFEFQF
jgi:hypothetical protein